MFSCHKKIIASILLVSLIFLIAPKPTYADAWGSNMEAAMWKQMMEETVKKIYDNMVAVLKMAAIKLIMSQLSNMLNKGGASGVGPISNWRQFIYGSANQYAMQMTNDFFRSMSSGTPSALSQRIIMPAQSAVMMSPYSLRPDLQNYVQGGEGRLIFTPGYAQNPWVAWNQAAKPQNDLAYMYMRGLDVQQNAYASQAEVKKAEGVAGAGYQSKTSGGNKTTGEGGQITTPGSTQKDLVTKVQSMPIDMVALSRTIPEIVAGMVTGMLTQMLNKGLVTVTSKLK